MYYNKDKLLKLERMQLRGIRIALKNQNIHITSNELRTRAKVHSLEKRRKYQLINNIYKYRQRKGIRNIIPNVRNLRTRNQYKFNLTIPNIKGDKLRYSPLIMGYRDWNALTVAHQGMPDHFSFKKEMKEILIPKIRYII